MKNRNFDERDLLRASDILKSNDKWCIFTHVKSDGDALGSGSALFEAAIISGKIVEWYSPDEKFPEVYKYLNHFEDLRTSEDFTFKNDGTLYIFLDCSTECRSVSGFDANAGINSLNIDHHEDNTNYAKINCVDGFASSTCEMLYRVFTAGKWEINRNMAESLYTGIITDTGSFSFSNTSPLTHKIAAELIKIGVDVGMMTNRIGQNKCPEDFLIWSKALSRVKVFGSENIFAVSMVYTDDFSETGADLTSTEGLSQMLMSLRGVKLAAFATEHKDGVIRLSVRSREGSPFGAGEFARDFGGGGHEKAAGCTFPYPAEKALDELEKSILKKYNECNITHQ